MNEKSKITNAKSPDLGGTLYIMIHATVHYSLILKFHPLSTASFQLKFISF